MIRQGLAVGALVAGAVLTGGWSMQVAAAEPQAAGGAQAGTVATSRPAATQPAATQPAENIVLVRLGDKATITQAEFERYFFGGPPASFKASKEQFMRELVERKWLLLYLEEHPERVPESAIQAQENYIKQRYKLKTDEDFDNWLKKTGRTMESWRTQVLLAAGRTALSNRGRERAKDQEILKKTFEARPADFNGTELSARHILIGSAPYDTPEEKKAKREKAEKLREALISGKLTWAEALKESTCPTRRNNGNLGYFTRHHRMMEGLAEAAFKQEPGKIGEVVETFLGFHILEVTKRHAGGRQFEDSKSDVRLWLEREPYLNAIMEMSRKYPAIGIQPPHEPPPRPITTRPSRLSKPTARPAATRPAGRAVPRPGTRPAGPPPRPRAATAPSGR